MLKLIVKFFAVLLVIVHVGEARRYRYRTIFDDQRGALQDFFQPPVPFESCCVTRGILARYTHAGVDIVCGGKSVGVVAMGDGDVVAACDGQPKGNDWSVRGQGGNFVKIKYVVGDKPLYVLYYHLAQGSVAARANTRVKKGIQVGMLGTTGFSTGNHLDVTSQTNPGGADGLYDPSSIVDFRKILDMDKWKQC